MIQDIEDSSDDEELDAIHANVVNSITSLGPSLPQAIKVRKNLCFLWIFLKLKKKESIMKPLDTLCAIFLSHLSLSLFLPSLSFSLSRIPIST